MTGARSRALFIIGAVLVAVIALVATFEHRRPAPLPSRPEGERPPLLLLTSLPLMFGEDFSLQDTGSPAIKALNSRYRVVPISVADPAGLANGNLLLMAHPLAQPAEDLVALDAWVRRGGRVMLLADPMLEWPGRRPLGDPLRPPPMFTDTGLLAHWGLRVEPPTQRGRRTETLGGFGVMTVSPGRLFGDCRVSDDRLVAHCRIGKGRATVVADADLLQGERLGAGGEHNLDGVLAELASLELK